MSEFYKEHAIVQSLDSLALLSAIWKMQRPCPPVKIFTLTNSIPDMVYVTTITDDITLIDTSPNVGRL